MPRIWFPGWLYHLLPLVYVVFAAAMFYWFGDRPVGRSSAVLLCAAAILIWGLRLHARRLVSRRKP